MKIISIENNSWDYVQRLIEREINSAFRLKENKMTDKTSFGEYFDNQRDAMIKAMQNKNKQLNVEWMEEYEKRKAERIRISDTSEDELSKTTG